MRFLRWLFRYGLTTSEFESRIRLGDESLGRWQHFHGDNLLHRLHESMFRTYCGKGAPIEMGNALFIGTWRLCRGCSRGSGIPRLTMRGWKKPQRKRIRRKYVSSAARHTEYDEWQ